VIIPFAYFLDISVEKPRKRLGYREGLSQRGQGSTQ
jgi:hypothetical protein